MSIEQSEVHRRLARIGFRIEEFIALLGAGRQDFEKLCADLEAEYQPQCISEDVNFHFLVMGHWRMAMCDQRDAAALSLPISEREKAKLLRQSDKLRRYA